MDADITVKEKSKRLTRQAAIDFVVPLQLEECIHRIRGRESRFPLLLKITSQGKDKAAFTGRLMETGEVTTIVRGTLGRWEGISTRFEGKLIIVSGSDFVERFELITQISSCLFVFFILFLVAILTFKKASGLDFVTIIVLFTLAFFYFISRIKRFITRRHFIRLIKDALQESSIPTGS